MNTCEKVRILAKICTRDEAGQHFTALYSEADLAELEADGLIEIDRPIHGTGIACSDEYWSVAVADEGLELVEANEEYWPE